MRLACQWYKQIAVYSINNAVAEEWEEKCGLKICEADCLVCIPVKEVGPTNAVLDGVLGHVYNTLKYIEWLIVPLYQTLKDNQYGKSRRVDVEPLRWLSLVFCSEPAIIFSLVCSWATFVVVSTDFFRRKNTLLARFLGTFSSNIKHIFYLREISYFSVVWKCFNKIFAFKKIRY